MKETIEVTRMHVFSFPNPPDDYGNRNLAKFTFEYAGIRVNAAMLCHDQTGQPYVRAAIDKPSGRRPRVQMLDAQLAQVLTDRAVSRYFAEGGRLIDGDAIAEFGYSNRVGLDGFPLHPNHPANREAA